MQKRYQLPETPRVNRKLNIAPANLRNSWAISSGDLTIRYGKASTALSDRFGSDRIHFSVVGNFHQLMLSHQSFDSFDCSGGDEWNDTTPLSNSGFISY
ncbi:hypothetical protein TNCV_3835301 [Trichonephila clavipes]|nr:hypothetical protein TNCV_3835301 [Trichonephila clavipes]